MNDKLAIGIGICKQDVLNVHNLLFFISLNIQLTFFPDIRRLSSIVFLFWMIWMDRPDTGDLS
jgi:glucose-6-phosphate-specific signal transduction histidine kinase